MPSSITSIPYIIWWTSSFLRVLEVAGVTHGGCLRYCLKEFGPQIFRSLYSRKLLPFWLRRQHFRTGDKAGEMLARRIKQAENRQCTQAVQGENGSHWCDAANINSGEVYSKLYSKYRGTLNLDLTLINIDELATELRTVDSFGWISGCRMKWSQSEGQCSHFWRCDLSDAPFICKLNGLIKATILQGHLTLMYRSLTYASCHAY